MGNNHTKMLKKFYELSLAGSFTIWIFLTTLFCQKLKFALFHYYRFVSGEDYHFRLLGRPTHFYGQELVLQKFLLYLKDF